MENNSIAIQGSQCEQLTLFIHRDDNYSNLFPKFHSAPIYDRRKSNYNWAVDNIDATHRFITKQDNIEYEIRVTGASIQRYNNKSKRKENCIFWPGDREERVVDAIMKIASNGSIDKINSKSMTGYGAYFTIYMIRQLTGMNARDVKEAIEILNKSNLEIICKENGQEELSASFLPVKYLSSDKSGRRDDKCYVIFHPAIMVGIDSLQFQPYLYDYSEIYNGSLPRYIHKRLVLRFRYAKDKETYHFRLRSAINDYGKMPESKIISYSDLRNLCRDMNTSLRALVDNEVIKPDFSCSPIRDDKSAIVDYKFTVSSHPRFSSHQKTVNGMAKRIRNHNDPTQEEAFLEDDNVIEHDTQYSS